MPTEDEVVSKAIRRQAELESKRWLFESLAKECAERMFWREDIFYRRGPIPQGEKRSFKSFDSTALSANERFAAAMESMLTPRTQKWHKVGPWQPDLKEDHDVKLYCEQLTDILFDARYSPKSNFAGQIGECFLALGAFGTTSLFIDESLGSNLRYKSCHWTEMFFSENHVGLIDTAYRRFPMTARQMREKWGDDKLAEGPKAALDNSPEREFEILHCVHPRTSVDYSRKDAQGMPWEELYIDISGRKLMEQAGYRTFPYAISRYVTSTREVYGRSPAMTALADIKMLDEMSKTIMRAGQRAVDPPVLLPEDGALQAFDLRAGALNYGGIDAKGTEMAKPFLSGAKIELGMEMLEARKKSVEDIFLVTLWRILSENPQMTATQALLLAQERGALIAPTMGRQQSEFLGPTIERELDMLARAGQLPPMPDVLRAAGGLVRIEYVSPFNRTMRAQEGVGILQTLEQLGPLAQYNPKVYNIFDPDKTARALAEINGAPESVLRSVDELAAMAQEAVSQQQAAALLQAAPIAASAAKDLTTAASTAANIPPPQPGIGAPPAQ